mmetsp:Transcript_21935/g.28402  ORF Transcript_21935/g.28402 Transcript_21935/m.28402 type:complete len:264 (+) Transcript_21935:159-950(+)|eukprot:CAMPEP_0198149268 /NCGR_PEP_ID=MMETSP1443-20131203/45767_1 /TAXON_ID=186043 /ORGANISM="Entomoneis sp., Strain CCMP2396" /LENGTH=263 /DNA_ID=CAMNT_0043814247 /DNA_START=119 /DNA_END=910 /DNA_ORIENTATION=+
MVIQVKKAGELVTRNVVARAISAKEAPMIAPARESTKVSMMPWKGWVQRLLRDQIGEKRFAQFREAVFFWPDDHSDLDTPAPGQQVSVSADGKTMRTYRYPSPGSEGPVKLPKFDVDTNEDPYDSGYFKHDTARRDEYAELGNPHIEQLKLSLLDRKYPNDPTILAEIAKLEEGPKSSPGNKGVFATGPSSFDPTGLRATMSVNWKSLNKSLDDNMPNHIPTPIWVGREEEEDKHYTDRGMPAPFGAYYEPLKVPTWRRVATW